MENMTIGVKTGSANPRAEFNLLGAVPTGLTIAAEGIRFKVAGNQFLTEAYSEIGRYNDTQVPSVVFGLWGRDVFSEPVKDFSVWLNHYFGWIPLFGGDGPFGRSILLGSLVLAIMVLPIVTSLSREVFQQTPGMNEEAALALGATKWEMIRTAVLPYGKPGVIAAVMLGLGRALGETIALALTLGTVFTISFNLIQTGGNSIAANIANTFGEANAIGRGALIASGLVLFAITLVVNMAARAIIYRRREFRDSAA